MVKRLSEDLLRLDVRRLQSENLLSSKVVFVWKWLINSSKYSILIKVEPKNDKIILLFQHKDSQGKTSQKEQSINLSRTTCNYGGSRVWFRCPSCQKRVAILYGDKMFACRKCQDLAYQSQRESSTDTGIRHVDRIRKKLGWCSGLLLPDGNRPKGMHHRTYQRLLFDLSVAKLKALESSLRYIKKY